MKLNLFWVGLVCLVDVVIVGYFDCFCFFVSECYERFFLAFCPANFRDGGIGFF